MSTIAPVAKETNPLLAKYLLQLAQHPLRTKSVTSGVLSFTQEVLGSNIAGVPVKRPSKDVPFLLHALARAHIDVKALKMACYGAFVSAPLSHFLIGLLQKAFAGKTSAAAKIGQILCSNLLIAPIQTSAYLASMAIINGAKTADEVIKTVKAGFLPVMRVQVVMSPTAMVFAQKFVPIELWVPFFNLVQFVAGTYFNTRVKQLRLAAAKEQEQKDAESKSE